MYTKLKMKNSKKLILITLFISLILISGCAIKEEVKSSETNTLSDKIEFADTTKAKELLMKDDVYINSLSPFDLKSKSGSEDSTIIGYKTFASNNTLEWTDEEKEIINKNFLEIQNKIAELNINVDLPENIYLIKSTCEEEGSAFAYTRNNYIVLREHSLSKKLLSHELFHIISRYNVDERNEIYESLGFNYEEVDFPSELKNNLITNPDAPYLDYVFNAEFWGKEESRKGVLITYSDRKYTGGSFFDYLGFGFYMLDTKEIFSMDKLVDFTRIKNFSSNIGENTDYIIHPEEISADHFMILITKNNISDLPNPELIEKMKEILK